MLSADIHYTRAPDDSKRRKLQLGTSPYSTFKIHCDSLKETLEQIVECSAEFRASLPSRRRQALQREVTRFQHKLQYLTALRTGTPKVSLSLVAGAAIHLRQKAFLFQHAESPATMDRLTANDRFILFSRCQHSASK